MNLHKYVLPDTRNEFKLRLIGDCKIVSIEEREDGQRSMIVCSPDTHSLVLRTFLFTKVGGYIDDSIKYSYIGAVGNSTIGREYLFEIFRPKKMYP